MRSGGAGAAEVVSEAGGEAFECRRTVHRMEADFDEAKLFGVVLGGHEGFVELLFSLNEERAASAENFGKLVVLPREEIVKGAVVDVAFGAVTGIVEHDDDRIEFVADGSREFHAGHLKGAVTDQDERAQFGIGELGADAGGDGKAHRSVICRSKEFSAMADEE